MSQRGLWENSSRPWWVALSSTYTILAKYCPTSIAAVHVQISIILGLETAALPTFGKSNTAHNRLFALDSQCTPRDLCSGHDLPPDPKIALDAPAPRFTSLRLALQRPTPAPKQHSYSSKPHCHPIKASSGSGPPCKIGVCAAAPLRPFLCQTSRLDVHGKGARKSPRK